MDKKTKASYLMFRKGIKVCACDFLEIFWKSSLYLRKETGLGEWD